MRGKFTVTAQLPLAFSFIGLVPKPFGIPITDWSQIEALHFWGPIDELLLTAPPTISWPNVLAIDCPTCVASSTEVSSRKELGT